MFGPASLVGGHLTTERERMMAQVFQPGHRYSKLTNLENILIRQKKTDFFCTGFSTICFRLSVVYLIESKRGGVAVSGEACSCTLLNALFSNFVIF